MTRDPPAQHSSAFFLDTSARAVLGGGQRQSNGSKKMDRQGLFQDIQHGEIPSRSGGGHFTQEIRGVAACGALLDHEKTEQVFGERPRDGIFDKGEIWVYHRAESVGAEQKLRIAGLPLCRIMPDK